MTNYRQCPNPACQASWGIEEISFQECDSCGYPRNYEEDEVYGAPPDDDDFAFYPDEVPETVPGPSYKVALWFTETYDTGWKNCLCSLCHGTIPQGQVPVRYYNEHSDYKSGIELVVCETCRPTMIPFGGNIDYTQWVGLVIDPGALDDFCENMEEYLKAAESKITSPSDGAQKQ